MRTPEAEMKARAAGYQHWGLSGLFLSKDGQRVLTAEAVVEELEREKRKAEREGEAAA